MFYYLENLTTRSVSTVEKPWEYKDTVVPPELTDKKAYREWCMNPATRHMFLSGNEGLDAGRRINYKGEDSNPIHKCHGLVVDYDASNKFDNNMLEDIKSGKQKWPSEYAPSYIAETFTKGHLRVVWLFEAPVLMASEKHYKKFVSILDKKIKFNKWFSGFEAESLGDSSHYFIVGHSYRECRPDLAIKKNMLDKWSYEAANLVMSSLVEHKFKIPMEEVALEVERQFPNRWSGPFEVGARGVRFWDSDSQDTTGAQVTEHGMMAYSGEQAFLPWHKILGSQFVEKFEADKMAGIIDSIVLEYKKGAGSTTYWICKKEENGEEKWSSMNQSQVITYLKCAGFSNSLARGQTATEIDKILNQIHLTNTVTGAFPYIHYPHGKRFIEGEWRLNTSTARVWPPAPQGLFNSLQEGREYFSTIWSFLSNFFAPVQNDPRSSNIQLEFFLTWLQHAYRGYYKQEPQPGLILLMAGPQSAGKTFILQRIIAPLLGGSHGIKDVLGGKHTDLLTQYPVAYIDDMSQVVTADEHRRYSEQIKALVSDHKITFDGKWKTTGDTWWFGRVVVCMNDDASSLRMLPDLSVSMTGKVGMLLINRYREDGFRFNPDWKVTREQVEKELPFFARYLLDVWVPPDYLVNHGDPRYFLTPYKHPSLFQEAQERGIKHELFELLQEFMEDNVAATGDDYTGWTGTTTALIGTLSSGKYEQIMRKWTSHRVGTALGLLATTTNLEKIRAGGNRSLWHIPVGFSYVDQQEFGHKVHTLEDEKRRMKALKKIYDLNEAGKQVPLKYYKDANPNRTPDTPEAPVPTGLGPNNQLESLAAAMRDGDNSSKNERTNSGKDS